MPDWNEFVRHQLVGIELNQGEMADVVEELAGHLEEAFRNLRCQGITEQEAVQRALQEVRSWQELRVSIESSRGREPFMNKRVSQFWFPAFLTLFLSQVALMVVQEFGPRNYLSPATSHPRMLPQTAVFAAWVAALPLIGALGAYLSGRAGGPAKLVFSAITFPVFPFLAFVVIGLPIAMLFDDHVARGLSFPLFLVTFSAWVVCPALALVAGGWFLRHFAKRSGRQNIAGN